jgi:tetratricopeptide (TPR) repeat protein
MAITKKKRRKKREPQKFELPQTEEEKSKIQYKDDFQTTVGKKLEALGSKLEGKGKMIMYGLAGLVVIALIAGVFYVNRQRTANLAEAALGDAITTSRARITDIPMPAGATEKTFKTKKERAEAAIKQFEAVSSKYGGEYAEKAAYFIALNRLDLDRAAGIKALQGLAGKTDDVGSLAKFALAQTMADDGKSDEAVKLYNELLKTADPIVSKTTISFALAKIYEKQGKKKEAAAIYFDVAKAASEAKDSDGKAIPMSLTETEAKTKLEELDPEKAKQIKEPEAPEGGGLPPGVLN